MSSGACVGPLDGPQDVAGRYRIVFFAWETTRIASFHRAALAFRQHSSAPVQSKP
jgi:hypothetical protein